MQVANARVMYNISFEIHRPEARTPGQLRPVTARRSALCLSVCALTRGVLHPPVYRPVSAPPSVAAPSARFPQSPPSPRAACAAFASCAASAAFAALTNGQLALFLFRWVVRLLRVAPT